MKRLWIIVAAIFAVVGLGRPALVSTFRFPSESGGAIDVINNPRLF